MKPTLVFFSSKKQYFNKPKDTFKKLQKIISFEFQSANFVIIHISQFTKVFLT
jgi:hypothetical protein